jgi:hypothetical protein
LNNAANHFLFFAEHIRVHGYHILLSERAVFAQKSSFISSSPKKTAVGSW